MNPLNPISGKRLFRPGKRRRSGTVGVRRGTIFSLFVVAAVALTLLSVELRGSGLAESLMDWLHSRSETVEEQEAQVWFDILPTTSAKYWRTGVFDTYEHGHWVTTHTSTPREYSGTPIHTGVSRYLSFRTYTLTVEVVLQMQVLPTVLNTRQVSLTNGDTRLTLDEYGLLRTSTGFTGRYEITYEEYVYTREMLAVRNITVPADIERYLSVSDVPVEVVHLSENLTRGLQTPFERVLSIATYVRHAYTLTSNFSYPSGSDPISHFLLDAKRGGTREFAGAVALMSRAVGVPARLVTGYVLGQVENGVRRITSSHRHYWVEVYFGDLGWLAVEASPGSGSWGVVTGRDPVVQGGGNGGPRLRTDPTPPDLSPSPPYSLPTGIYPGGEFTFHLPVNNYGYTSVSGVRVGISLNNRTRVLPVPWQVFPYESALMPITLTVDRAGPQVAEISLDPEDVIPETNERNNDVQVTFDVVSGIDLTVTIERASVGSGTRAYGEDLNAALLLENHGDLNAFLVDMVLSYGNFSMKRVLPALNAGAVEKEVISLPHLPVGAYEIMVEVDPFGKVDELNEENNEDSVVMHIIPRFTVVEVTWTDEDGDGAIAPGDTLKVLVRSNLMEGTRRFVMVRESDPNGELRAYTEIPGGSVVSVSFQVDHPVIDLTEAEITVVET